MRCSVMAGESGRRRGSCYPPLCMDTGREKLSANSQELTNENTEERGDAMEAGRPWESPSAGCEAPQRTLGIAPRQIAGVEELGAGLSGARIQRLTLRSETPGGAHAYRQRVVKWLAP